MDIEKSNLKIIAYQECGGFVRQHESMLFQRLNYFLVAIAFLVAGFVELAASSTQHHANSLLAGLAILVGAAGFLISWLFTAINYLNGGTLTRAYVLAEHLEKQLFVDKTSELAELKLPYRHMSDAIFESSEFRFGFKMFFYDSVAASFLHFNFNTDKGELRAPHTWIIPFYFTLFWLAALSIYCFFLIHWWTLFVGSPIIYDFIVVIIYNCKCHSMVGSNNIIGENIRKAREKAGKTQTDLAIQLHRLKVKIDRSKIAKIEIGAKSISDIEAIAVAEALKISVESLFEGSESKFNQRIEHLK